MPYAVSGWGERVAECKGGTGEGLFLGMKRIERRIHPLHDEFGGGEVVLAARQPGKADIEGEHQGEQQ